jgi:hypothetical protein
VLRRNSAGVAAWHVFATMLHTSALGALTGWNNLRRIAMYLMAIWIANAGKQASKSYVARPA